MPQPSGTGSRPAGHPSNWHRVITIALWLGVVVGVAYLLYDFSHSDFSNMAASGFDILGGYAFLFTAVWLLSLFRPKAKHRFLTLFALLVFYLGSYSVLSAFGEYHWSWSGRLRYSSGLSVTDIEHWSPKGVYWERYTRSDGSKSSRGTSLGYYYSPLLVIDRMWFHPTQDLFADDSKPTSDARNNRAR